MFNIVWTYKGNQEIIDTAETMKEAETLAKEYTEAFKAKIEIAKN